MAREILKQFIGYLVTHKRWWLLPFIIVSVVLALLIAASEVVPIVSPFIYTLF